MYGNKLNQWDSTCSGILGDSLTICDQGYIYLNFSFNIFEIIKLLESVEGSVATELSRAESSRTLGQLCAPRVAPEATL